MGKQADEKTMLHFQVPRTLDAKISELSQKMGISKASMCGMLMEAAIEDNEFIIRAVAHPLAKRVMFAVSGKKAGNVKLVME